MESLLILAGLVFIGAPVVLLLLVVGARSRVTALERRVERLQNELQALRGQPERASGVAAEKPASVEPVPLATTREDVAESEEAADYMGDEAPQPDLEPLPQRERWASDVPQILEEMKFAGH
ncbi:MAG: hypothetical protein ABI478_02100 [Propionivibrio sp.]